jgi:ADP-heptose:LPS heptosyltransferase
VTSEISTLHPELITMTHLKLGDFLLLTPHLRILSGLYPDLLIAVPDFLYPLYTEQKIFPNSLAISEVPKLSRKLRVLDLTFPFLPHIQIPEHYERLRAEVFLRGQHVSYSYAEALHEHFPLLPLGVPSAPFLDFTPNTEYYSECGVEPYQFFTVHSGSDFAPKNWAPENFENTVIALLDCYPKLKALSFVGPQDDELFLTRAKPKRFLTVKRDLRVVAHLLMGSLFHIDNDSGVHHLAGAANVPSITVFGATGPGTWSSLTQRNFIHWGGLNCDHHCSGSLMRDCPDRVCISSVKVEHILKSADKILSAYPHLDLSIDRQPTGFGEDCTCNVARVSV